MDKHQEALAKANEYIKAHINDKDKSLYPNFHMVSPLGWINDPNGFCYALGNYHIFYQYYPYDAKWGPCHWGHAISKDLVHWEHLPVALAPSEDYDISGCFSGSGIEVNGKLYLFYTGHKVLVENGEDSIFKECQCIAVSEDGVNFRKLGVFLYPEEDIMHFRDPKVWQDEKGLFHVVLGISERNDKGEVNKVGRIRHYVNTDIEAMNSWKLVSNVYDFGETSYMPECPDMFSVDHNKWVIACSPMGLKPRGFSQQNPATNVWLYGTFDNTNFKAESDFFDVDNGHDFYATQSALSPDGRRILMAWRNMWHLPFLSYSHKWNGALTLPRVITYKDGHIYQQPIKELESLRLSKHDLGEIVLKSDFRVLRASADSCELNFIVKPHEILAEQYGLALGSSIRLFFDRQANTLTLFRLDLNASSYRSIELDLSKEHKLQIYIDSNSIEVFIDDGYSVMTTNYYGEDRKLSLYSTNGRAVFTDLVLYDLERCMFDSKFHYNNSNCNN